MSSERLIYVEITSYVQVQTFGRRILPFNLGCLSCTEMEIHFSIAVDVPIDVHVN